MSPNISIDFSNKRDRKHQNLSHTSFDNLILNKSTQHSESKPSNRQLWPLLPSI